MHLNTNAFSFQPDLKPEDVESIVDNSFSALTTTSPNSLLLASLDASLAEYQHSGTDRLSSLCTLAATLKDSLKQGIAVLLMHGLDSLKVICECDASSFVLSSDSVGYTDHVG